MKSFALILCSMLLLTNAYFYKPSRYISTPPGQYNANFNYQNQTLVNNTELGLPYQGEIWTGYLGSNLSSPNSKIFYMLYADGGANSSSNITNSTAPVILWMQGGPGCSDWSGNFFEIGPLTLLVNSNGTVVAQQTEINWNDAYNLLFVDQPIGVGFSVSGGETITTSTQAALQMEQFLINFYENFPSLASNGLYIFGESYAGHYIPALASRLVSNYANNGIQLSGIGIGDGLTDPFIQATAYSEYTYAAGLIDENTRDQLIALETKAQIDALNGDFSGTAGLFDKILGIIGDIANIDVYNYRVYDGDGGDPIDPTSTWLNYTSTTTGLNIDPVAAANFADCNGPMYNNFYNDIGQSFAVNYSYLLTQTILPIDVLLYNGQNDIICNTPGSLDWINELDWPGVAEFRSAPRNIWYSANGSVVGKYKQYEQLTFVLVDDAGHMVPGDQPESARDMLGRFINNVW